VKVPMECQNGHMEDENDLVRIYSTESASDGLLAKGRLESEGIPVMIKGEMGGPTPTGATYLFVPRSFEEVARAILDSISELNQD